MSLFGSGYKIAYKNPPALSGKCDLVVRMREPRQRWGREPILGSTRPHPLSHIILNIPIHS